MTKIARKCRLYPTSDQQRQLAAVFGCCRKVYNLFIDLAWEENREASRVPSHFDMNKKLTEIKRQEEYQYLREVPTQALQGSLKNLRSAFDRYFNKKLKTGPPQYKSRFKRQSASYPQHCRVSEKRVWIPKIGWIRYRGDTNRRDHDGKTVTVSLDTDGRYYASFNTEVQEIPVVQIKASEVLGLDLGIKDLAVTSEGIKINPDDVLPYFTARDQQLESRVRRLQKRLAKGKKGSKRRGRVRLALAKAYGAQRRLRHYLRHLLTSELLKKWYLVIEDLNVSGMLRNRKLSRHIQRLGWGEIRRCWEYKAALFGRRVIKADRWFPSSKLCSACGVKNEDLTLSDRLWTCECGAKHDRDPNSAVSLKVEGLRILRAEGVPVLA